MVAAAIPLAFGALTVFAGRGVLALLSSAMTIDALSLVVCTMMGLALGVDYSLLIVSRFREELEAGREPWTRGRRRPGQRRSHHLLRRRHAGRRDRLLRLPAARLAAALAGDGGRRSSTVISVVVSTLAVPPLLALLGERINAGRIAGAAPAVDPGCAVEIHDP